MQFVFGEGELKRRRRRRRGLRNLGQVRGGVTCLPSWVAPATGHRGSLGVWSLSWPILLKSRCGMSGTPLERPPLLEGEKELPQFWLTRWGGMVAGAENEVLLCPIRVRGWPKKGGLQKQPLRAPFFLSGGEYCQAFPIHQRPHLPSPTNTPHKARVRFAPRAGLEIVGVNLHRLLEEKPQTPGPSAEYPQIQGPDPRTSGYCSRVGS